MRWRVWSWWRLEFPRSSWHCWRCLWCLCRFFSQSSSVNTQQGPDHWTSSIRPFLSGTDARLRTCTHSIDQKLTECCDCRLLIGLEYALLVWWTSSVKQDGGFPVYYYSIVLFSYAVHQVQYSSVNTNKYITPPPPLLSLFSFYSSVWYRSSKSYTTPMLMFLLRPVRFLLSVIQLQLEILVAIRSSGAINHSTQCSSKTKVSRVFTPGGAVQYVRGLHGLPRQSERPPHWWDVHDPAEHSH